MWKVKTNAWVPTEGDKVYHGVFGSGVLGDCSDVSHAKFIQDSTGDTLYVYKRGVWLAKIN